MSLPKVNLKKIDKTLKGLENTFLSYSKKIDVAILKELEPIADKALKLGKLPKDFSLPGQKRFESLFFDFFAVTLGYGILSAKEEMSRIPVSFSVFFSENFDEAVPKEALDWVNKWTSYFGADYYQDKTSDVVKVLDNSIKSGATIEDTMEALSRYLTGPGFNTFRLETIARTNSTTAFNQGRLTEFYSEKDLVAGFEFSAIMDERTTDICIERHGKIIPIEALDIVQMNTPPLHYNCRSVLLPLSRKEFDEIQGKEEGASDWKGLMKPENNFGKVYQDFSKFPALQGKEDKVEQTEKPKDLPTKKTGKPKLAKRIDELKKQAANSTGTERMGYVKEAGKLIDEALTKSQGKDLKRFEVLNKQQIQKCKELAKIKVLEEPEKFKKIKEEIAAIGAEKRELGLKLNDKTALLEELKKYREFGGSLEKVFFVNQNEKKKVNEEYVSQYKEIQKYFPTSWINRLNEEGGKDIKIIISESKAKKNQRAFYRHADWLRELFLNTHDSGKNTMAHESAHMYSHFNSNVMDVSIDFLVERGKERDCRIKSMRNITGISEYSKDEVALNGAFGDGSPEHLKNNQLNYMAKLYTKNNSERFWYKGSQVDKFRIRSNEFISMGTEALFFDFDLKNKDREAYQVMIGLFAIID